MFPKAIIERIIEAGGRPFAVGGYPRDIIASRISGSKAHPKDIDIEVYGIGAKAIMDAVRPVVAEAKIVGAQFPIIWIRTRNGEQYEIAIPRGGATTIAEGARYRDFTMNGAAIGVDGQIIDTVGAEEDIRNGTIRIIDRRYFAEGEYGDVGRVMRGMQFAARKGMSVDRESAKYMRSIRGRYGEIAIERIWGEWKKWAKAEFPSYGIEYMYSTGWIYIYPAIAKMIGVPQDAQWHPEGSAYQHMKCSVDAAAAYARREGFNETETITIVFAAMCHDFGKPQTTVRSETSGRWISPGHAEAGVEIAREFMVSIGAPAEITDAVCEITAYHMSYLGSPTPLSRRSRSRRIAAKMKAASVKMIRAIMEIDHSARPWTGEWVMSEEAQAFAEAMVEAKAAIVPFVQGRDMIAMGMQPGPEMGRVIRAVAEAQVEGTVASREAAMAMAMGMIAKG
jgi:tRNA nucleotidyltransferase (CCA-adding enzyme)